MNWWILPAQNCSGALFLQHLCLLSAGPNFFFHMLWPFFLSVLPMIAVVFFAAPASLFPAYSSIGNLWVFEVCHLAISSQFLLPYLRRTLESIIGNSWQASTGFCFAHFVIFYLKCINPALTYAWFQRTIMEQFNCDSTKCCRMELPMVREWDVQTTSIIHRCFPQLISMKSRNWRTFYGLSSKRDRALPDLLVGVFARVNSWLATWFCSMQ